MQVERGMLGRCNNCKHGHLEFKNSKLVEVWCRKFKGEVKINVYKKLMNCQWFEKR